jgi:hypothetical protein
MPSNNLSWREIGTFVISIAVIAGFFGLLFTNKIPNEQMDFVIGALVGWVAASVQYYVGSSQGSTAKGNTIEKLTEK